MERVGSGIEGLDKMLDGGFLKGRPYIIAGGPGAGKTVLCMQFLMAGAKKKEKGIYIALEEQAAELREDMAQFGWDLHNIKIVDTVQEISSGVWALKTDSVISRPELNISNIAKMIENKIENYSASRVVIDSVTTIRMLASSSGSVRSDILSLINFLKKKDCTTLLTLETEDANRVLMEEFLVSGVIKLHNIQKDGEYVSALSIEKFRGSSFDKHLRPFKITSSGMKVFSDQTLI